MSRLSDTKKSPTAKIFLLLAVLIIWAAIFIRFFKMTGKPDSMVFNNKDIPGEKLYADSSDTFTINGHHADPFLKHQRRKIASDKAKVTRKVPNVKKNAKTCLWPVVRYGGLIKNAGGNKETALLEINGKNYLATKSLHVKDCDVLQIYPDSITLKKDDCIKTFRRVRK